MFDLNASSLFASLIWGALGSGMFIFGWKQKSPLPLAFGLGLTAISYFIGSALYMSLAGVALLVIMYLLKKQSF